MGFSIVLLFTLQTLLAMALTQSIEQKIGIFREYIGADSNNVKFADVPINPNVEFHYILAFAIDYTTTSSSSESTPYPTDGKFNVFWDTENCSPSAVSLIKKQHSNVKVALSIGGDTVAKGKDCYFSPSSVDSWVSNAVSSLTNIIKEYNLDGIDIDYEHFDHHVHPEIFADCIGKVITTLKKNGVISFVSIAPFEDSEVRSHYLALWRSYGHVIDYVNFQFYAYDKGTTVSQFMEYFRTQSENYKGGNILVSFTTEGSGGLTPENGFFIACKRLKNEGKLQGIFVWSADSSKALGFRYEKQSQALLAVPHLYSIV